MTSDSAKSYAARVVRRGGVAVAVVACALIGTMTSCSTFTPAGPVASVASVAQSTTTDDAERISLDGRTLLLHSARDDVDQTDFSGLVSANDAGCVTVGGFAIIAPEGSRLLADGSIVVRGALFRVGTTAHVGGARSPVEPGGDPCGAGKDGYWIV